MKHQLLKVCAPKLGKSDRMCPTLPCLWVIASGVTSVTQAETARSDKGKARTNSQISDTAGTLGSNEYIFSQSHGSPHI